MVGDRRLYVKVIKGNALTLPGKGNVNAVCYISTDEPVQSYQSTVVKSSANPFWDEHFLFDITNETRELRFEVYDKTHPERGEEYIGESTIYIEDLKKTPSSRQILRLQSQPGSFDYSTGTLTAECLFMEPAEADQLLNSMVPSISQLSPRRRIEVSQMVTPGGTRVTTTTTTTQKPQYGRPDAGYNTTPNYIEKHIPVDLDASYMSSNPGDSSAELVVINGVESVADTAIRELMDRSRRPRTPTKTSTLIITGVKRTIESSPTDESPGRALSSQTSPERQGGRGLTPETDDLELVRPQDPGSPNLKKTRSLGGSLKKLFRRGRKSRSRARDGDTSRESSQSRGSGRNPASRDGSLNRQSGQNRASSVS
ncbi:hypothetical protein V1264_017519 [Littorina saxatilis]|uniref:C2 domain-containing protein n=1 Tax=Littorina saxatilis TaxID=31220 RepID=A0AAN9BIH9_9CAEN